MRAAKKSEVLIQKLINVGADLPPFLEVAHRHFQKSCPITVKPPSSRLVLTIPVDMLALIAPGELLDAIESIEVVYQS